MAAVGGNLAGYRATLYQHSTVVAHNVAGIATVGVLANRIGTCRQVPTSGNQQDIANLPMAGTKFIGAIPTTISDNTSTFSVTMDFTASGKPIGFATDDGTTQKTYMIVWGGNDVNGTNPPTAGYVAFFDAYVAGANVTAELSDVIQMEVKLARTSAFDLLSTV